MRAARVVAAALLVLCPAAVADERLDAGRRVYLEGIQPDGTAVEARGANAVALRGADAACQRCHRRSGAGTAEGSRVVPPLRYLFTPRAGSDPRLRAQPVSGTVARATYDAAAFARAVRDGVASDGRALDALMPRYALDDAATEGLARYVAGLAAEHAPGVADDVLHFATVVTPDADPQRAAAVVDVLAALVADRNGGTRAESRRRSAGSDWMYQGYRRWQLDVWRLEGEAASWKAQLEAHYRDAPVFALLSGAGAGQWLPVHEFCREHAIPCLLPVVDAAAPPAEFPAVYFADFPRVEAAAIAAWIGRERHGGPVVQVYAGDYGREAATALREALPNGLVADAEWPGAPPWETNGRGSSQPGVLVLWLACASLASPALLEGLDPGTAVLVSAVLCRPDELPEALATRPGTRMAYPYDLPEERAPRMRRVQAWMHARGLEPRDPVAEANAYFAGSLAMDVVGHMGGEYSRDLFVERVEHMAGRAPNTSAFPRIGLAPDQRTASKGAYVVRIDGPNRKLVPEGGWIVP